MIEKDIQQLCLQHSELGVEDIGEIIKEANRIEHSNLYQTEDVFIDILSDITDEAIVVYHRRPKLKTSIYQKRVVGKVAKRLNEPGVYRTFETSLNTEGLLGKTQENKLIRQKVFPIRNNQTTIAVIIIEAPVKESSRESFYVASEEDDLKDQGEIAQSPAFYQSLINRLDEAILIFDQEGYLIMNNQVAESYYYHFGYMEKINGFHYDNLSIDTSTFEQLLYLRNAGKWAEMAEKEIYFGETHFKMTRFFDLEAEKFSMILHDKTEIYNKEVEIVTKSVAIKEIHHRVKNNLQSIVSLLRIQGRRSKSEEVRKLLRESESRILAIAKTHEILSKQIADDITLCSVLDGTISNVHRAFLGSKHITLEKEIDQSIYLDSDKTVSVALIVNELLQNSFEHGFVAMDQLNLIQVTVSKMETGLIVVEVKDNGGGYNPKKNQESSLGLQIVTSYVKEKLRGKLQIRSNQYGTTTRFFFKA